MNKLGGLSSGVVQGIGLGFQAERLDMAKETQEMQKESHSKQMDLVDMEIDRLKDTKTRRDQLRDIGTVEYALRTGNFTPAALDAWNRIYEPIINQGGPDGAKKRVVDGELAPGGDGFMQTLEITREDGSKYYAPMTTPDRDENDQEVAVIPFEDAFEDLETRKALIREMEARRIQAGDSSPLQRMHQAEVTAGERAHEMALVDRKGQWDMQSALAKYGLKNANKVDPHSKWFSDRVLKDFGTLKDGIYSLGQDSQVPAAQRMALAEFTWNNSAQAPGTENAIYLQAAKLHNQFLSSAKERAASEAKLQNKEDDRQWINNRANKIVDARIQQYVENQNTRKPKQQGGQQQPGLEQAPGAQQSGGEQAGPQGSNPQQGQPSLDQAQGQQGGYPEPDPSHINYLRKHRYDPQVIKEFNEVYGPGRAEQLLGNPEMTQEALDAANQYINQNSLPR